MGSYHTSGGGKVAASLPNNSTRDKKDLQDKLYEQDKSKELTKVGSLKIVEEWLKKELGEEDLYKCVRGLREFEACKQKTKKWKSVPIDSKSATREQRQVVKQQGSLRKSGILCF